MKVLFINTYHMHGGAGRAACALQEGVRAAGVDARMLVQNNFAGVSKTVQGPQTRLERAKALLAPALEMLPLLRYRGRNRLPFSAALVPDRIGRRVAEIDPDLVHLHWVNGGFLRIETLGSFARPLLWTLHDSWPFTGGCHIPLECTRYTASCGGCPALGSTSRRDLSSCVWRRKKKGWQGLPLTIVTPSRWLAECARSSSLFAGRRVEVIPNGLDLKTMRQVEKELACSLLSLDPGKRYLLFGAVSSTDDRNKGFHLLAPALQKAAAALGNREVEVLVFGADEPADPPDLGFRCRYLGYFHDRVSLNLLYAAADLFLVPSLQENLPNTIMEAMACGTPCVAFSVGGIPDLIDHEVNGYLARPRDPESLAHGVQWVLADDERHRGLRRRARDKVEGRFDLEKVSREYLRLYEELVADRPAKRGDW